MWESFYCTIICIREASLNKGKRKQTNKKKQENLVFKILENLQVNQVVQEQTVYATS